MSIQTNYHLKNFSEHLFELRKRLIFCLWVILLAFAICWFLKEWILQIVSRPIAPYLTHTQDKLIFTAPMDEFLAYVKLSFFSSIVFSCPVLMYQFWRFLAPGLHATEQKTILVFSVLSTLLFLTGILFIYFIVYPLTFQFLLGFGSSTALISIKEYLSFFLQTSIAFGLLFETPLILIGCVWFQLLSVRQLKKGRRYAVVILAALSAVFTPPDILSMFLLLIPLYLLYEASIFFSAFIKK